MDRLDRIFQARREVVTGLSMDSLTESCDPATRSEKVDVGFRRKSGGRAKLEERPRRVRERAPRQVALHFIGKDENGAAGHTIWI